MEDQKVVKPAPEDQTPSGNEADPGSALPQTQPEKATRPEPASKRRATGPRTEAGKGKSSKNSRRRGIFEKAIFLEGESSAQFNSLVRRLKADVQGLEELECILMEKVAAVLWREARFVKAETELLNAMEFLVGLSAPGIERLEEDLSCTESSQTPWKKQALAVPPEILERFAGYERHLGRVLDRTFSRIEWIRRMRSNNSHPSTLNSPEHRESRERKRTVRRQKETNPLERRKQIVTADESKS